MNHNNKIIIIYHAADHLMEMEDEWVGNFKRFLEMLLRRLSKNSLDIQIVEAANLSVDDTSQLDALLVPIVGEELLDSGIFKDFIKQFHNKAIHKEKNTISWDSRIFKVFRKSHLGNSLLDFISNSTNYNFFHIDPATEKEVVYNDFTGVDSEKTFWLRLYDLAYDLSKVVEQANSSEELSLIAEEINATSVYLAAVGNDLVDERNIVKRELTRNGFKVLPHSNLPDDLESVIKMVKRDLEKCKMSIHLVGKDYVKIKGTNLSLIDLQNRLAAEHFDNLNKIDSLSKDNYGRLIWVTPDLENASIKQRLYIENLRKDADSMKQADLLETNIEGLKTFLNSKLHKIKEAKEKDEINEQTSKKIYLICEKEEYSKCQSVIDFLSKEGFKILTFDYDGQPEDVRQKHNENLTKCDATLIYYGHENDKWMRSKLKDMLKSLGMGREKPFSAKGIIIENERQLDKILGLDKDAIVLQNSGELTPQTLEPFLVRLSE